MIKKVCVLVMFLAVAATGRCQLKSVGEVPADYVSEITEGLWQDAVSVEVNRRIVKGGYDLIISPGQVVPHEVIGRHALRQSVQTVFKTFQIMNKLVSCSAVVTDKGIRHFVWKNQAYFFTKISNIRN